MFKKDQKGVIDPIFIIALILVLAVGGIVLWRMTSDNSVSQENTNQASNEAIKESYIYEGVEVPANWELHQNEEYGISLNYPDGWDVKESEFEIMDASDFVYDRQVFGISVSESGVQGGYTIFVVNAPLHQLLDEDKKANSEPYGSGVIESKEEKVSMNGYQGVKYTITLKGGDSEELTIRTATFYYQVGDNTYKFSYVYEEDPTQVINEEQSQAIFNSLVIKR